MRYISALVVMLLAFLCTTGIAVAAAPDDGSLIDLARPVFDAVMSGEYVYAAALALVLLVAIASRYGSRWMPFLGTGPGKVLLVVLGSFAASVSTALAAGVALSAAMFWTATKVAVTAAGGFSILKAMLKPLLPKLPSWARKPLSWVFASRSIEDAEKAGDKAVGENPGGGVPSVTGDPIDVA